MAKYIEEPNMPCTKVSLCVVDMRARKSIIDGIRKSGAEVIQAGKCDELYDSVCCHPDMYIHHLGLRNVVAAPNSPKNTIYELQKRGFNIIKGQKAVSGKYPDSVAYNVARIGEFAVCCMKYCDPVLLRNLYDMNIKIIDVKQGYSKCSVCIVNSRAVITSDDGIYNALLNNGFDVLKISPGYISLPDLNYGFIGGASGLLDDVAVSFAGNIEGHPDFKKIEIFLSKYGKRAKSLDSLVLTDLGSIIPLME